MNLATKVHQQQIHDLIQTLRYEAGLSKRITAHLRGLEKDLLGAYLNAGDITSQRKLKALLDEARAAIADRYDAAKGVYDDEIPQLAEIGASKAVAALNGAIKVDIFSMSLTKDQLEAIASDVLIQGAPSAEWWGLQEAETLRKFKNAVRGGMLRGATGDEMAREVRDLMGVSMRNAQALVRTSVITVNNAAHEAAYAANADLMAGTQWMATLDPRTCSACGGLDGQEWPWGDPHPSPSLHWGCFVAGTKVQSPNILRGFERPYSGNVVIIRTAGGNEITCTPNHPILTPRGWVAAGDLKEGDEVVKSLERDWVPGSTPDGVEVETRIEDVVCSLLGSRGMVPVAVPLTAEDFHGDALNHQVATVWANRELWDGGNASRLDHLEELGLIDGTAGGNVSLACERCKGLLEKGLDPSFGSLVCILREAQSLALGGLGHPDEHPFTLVSRGDAGFLEPKDYAASRDMEVISQGLSARAGIVEPDYFGGINRESICEGEPSIMQCGIDGLPVDMKGCADFRDTHPVYEGCDDQTSIDGPPSPQAKDGDPVRLEDCDNPCSGNPIGPGDLCNGLAGTVSQANVAFVHDRGLWADGDAVHLEQFGDEMVVRAEFARDLVRGCTIPVCLDDVVSVRREFLDGHVYNLETEGNWYVANGIITHNCRCAILPVTKSWETLAREAGGNTDLARKLDAMSPGTRASMDGQVSAKTTYEEWLSTKPEAMQRQILGPARYRLLESGKLKLSDLTDMRGNELTLKELAKL